MTARTTDQQPAWLHIRPRRFDFKIKRLLQLPNTERAQRHFHPSTPPVGAFIFAVASVGGMQAVVRYTGRYIDKGIHGYTHTHVFIYRYMDIYDTHKYTFVSI